MQPSNAMFGDELQQLRAKEFANTSVGTQDVGPGIRSTAGTPFAGHSDDQRLSCQSICVRIGVEMFVVSHSVRHLELTWYSHSFLEPVA
jgi:hypothetical protein